MQKLVLTDQTKLDLPRPIEDGQNTTHKYIQLMKMILATLAGTAVEDSESLQCVQDRNANIHGEHTY